MGETEFETGGDWSAEDQADLDGFLAETEGADADGTDWTADDEPEHEPARVPRHTGDYSTELASNLLAPGEYTDAEVRQIEAADFNEEAHEWAQGELHGAVNDEIILGAIEAEARRAGWSNPDPGLVLAALKERQARDAAALLAAGNVTAAQASAVIGSPDYVRDTIRGACEFKANEAVRHRITGGPMKPETYRALNAQGHYYPWDERRGTHDAEAVAERERIGARAIAEAERRVGTANPGGEPGTRPVFGARRQ